MIANREKAANDAVNELVAMGFKAHNPGELEPYARLLATMIFGLWIKKLNIASASFERITANVTGTQGRPGGGWRLSFSWDGDVWPHAFQEFYINPVHPTIDVHAFRVREGEVKIYFVDVVTTGGSKFNYVSGLQRVSKDDLEFALGWVIEWVRMMPPVRTTSWITDEGEPCW